MSRAIELAKECGFIVEYVNQRYVFDGLDDALEAFYQRQGQ